MLSTDHVTLLKVMIKRHLCASRQTNYLRTLPGSYTYRCIDARKAYKWWSGIEYVKYVCIVCPCVLRMSMFLVHIHVYDVYSYVYNNYTVGC